jgi:hypothetical protein
MPRILRVAHTPPSAQLSVVRMIVPGLEFVRGTQRIGPRLRKLRSVRP